METKTEKIIRVGLLFLLSFAIVVILKEKDRPAPPQPDPVEIERQIHHWEYLHELRDSLMLIPPKDRYKDRK